MAAPDAGVARRLPLLATRGERAPRASATAVAGRAPSTSRYYLETWGCQMNVHDSERFAGQLKALGFERTDEDSHADLILLNTCSVRERAEDKLFSRLGRLRDLKRE